MNSIVKFDDAVVTMSSLELVDFINSVRGEEEAGLQHKDFLAKVPKVLGVETSEKFSADLPDSYGRPRRGYRFPKRESCLMAMSYSYELQAVVFDHMTALEEQVSKPRLPQTYLEALKELVHVTEVAEQQALRIEQDKPKVEFVDKYVESTGLKGFREVAKLLGVKEPAFRQFLVDEKIMYKLGGQWVAYEPHLTAGRFEPKTGTGKNEHSFVTHMFTPKGVEYVAGKWASYQLNKDDM